MDERDLKRRPHVIKKVVKVIKRPIAVKAPAAVSSAPVSAVAQASEEPTVDMNTIPPVASEEAVPAPENPVMDAPSASTPEAEIEAAPVAENIEDIAEPVEEAPAEPTAEPEAEPEAPVESEVNEFPAPEPAPSIFDDEDSLPQPEPLEELPAEAPALEEDSVPAPETESEAEVSVEAEVNEFPAPEPAPSIFDDEDEDALPQPEPVEELPAEAPALEEDSAPAPEVEITPEPEPEPEPVPEQAPSSMPAFNITEVTPSLTTPMQDVKDIHDFAEDISVPESYQKQEDAAPENPVAEVLEPAASEISEPVVPEMPAAPASDPVAMEAEAVPPAPVPPAPATPVEPIPAAPAPVPPAPVTPVETIPAAPAPASAPSEPAMPKVPPPVSLGQRVAPPPVLGGGHGVPPVQKSMHMFQEVRTDNKEEPKTPPVSSASPIPAPHVPASDKPMGIAKELPDHKEEKPSHNFARTAEELANQEAQETASSGLYDDNFAVRFNLPPKVLTTKYISFIFGGILLFGIILGTFMGGGDSCSNKPSGLSGVVSNPEVPRGRQRCGIAEKSQGCVLYLMNYQRRDVQAKDFYPLVAQMTGVQRYLIETGNMRYGYTTIKPGYIAQFNVPPVR